MRPRVLVIALLALVALQRVHGLPRGRADGEPVSVEPPAVGDCRLLEPDDIAGSSNDTDPVSCKDAHTARRSTSASSRARTPTGGRTIRRWAPRCSTPATRSFRRFTGADESLAMRTVLSWAWFGPSEAAWEDGARWFRCDVVGGTQDAEGLVGAAEDGEGRPARHPGRPVAVLCRRGNGRRRGADPVQRASTPGGRSRRSWSGRRRRSTPATGSWRCAAATSARTGWGRG